MHFRQSSVGILGLGNLGKSLAQGFIRRNNLLRSKDQLRIFASTKESFTSQFPIKIFPENTDLVKSVDHLILCVKPNQIKDICQEINSVINPETSVISMAAGVSYEKLNQWLPYSKYIIRGMPTISSEIGQSSLYYYTDLSTKKSFDILTKLFDQNQIIALENEEKLDSATLISSCGPAFVAWYLKQFYCYEHSTLTDEELKLMLTKMLKGTADLLAVHSIDEIISLISSPGGITENTLKFLNNKNLDLEINQASRLAMTHIKNLNAKNI